MVSNRRYQVISSQCLQLTSRYVGYDALCDWKKIQDTQLLPYTHNWHAVAALHMRLNQISSIGLEEVFMKHKEIQVYTRDRLVKMGVELYIPKIEDASPTVTAGFVPKGWTWEHLDTKLREKGVVLGGTYGKVKGQLFRIGHMGTQASLDLVKKGLDVLEEILGNKH